MEQLREQATPMRDWLGNCWYDFCYSVSWATMSSLFSLRFEGGRNVPDRGPALLVANHQSFFDPPAVGLSVRRRLCYLARQTLFRHRLFGKLLRSLKSVPVDQDGVAAAGLRAIIDNLEHGEAVLVFPEGERSWNGVMQPFKPGVALIIQRVAPPIIPIGIAGAYEALSRHATWPRLSPIFMPRTGTDIAVSIGKPLDGNHFAKMRRDELCAALCQEVHKEQLKAEKLRRKM
jgi:1-acyl-sn-glycerol-3-phosphate acyltransferase